jgi:CsoR family transcriptional regulator, copper-sensing transcriptional repressor
MPVHPEHNEATIARLRRIEGQVRGLQRMLEEGRECEDVMTQMMAIRSGLEQVSLLLLDVHIKSCLLADIPVDDQTITELQQTLRMWARFGAPATQLPD